MAKGKQLDNQTIYNIMLSYSLTKNFSETARSLKVPVTTVGKIVRANKDKPEYVKLCQDKKEEFAEESSIVINMLLEAVKIKAQKLLDDGEALDGTKLTEITTSLGTLFDKRALTQGESTTNVTFKLPDEVREFAK